MMKRLTHDGYTGSIEVDFEERHLHGRVQDIPTIIYDEGEAVEELVRALEEAVDD